MGDRRWLLPPARAWNRVLLYSKERLNEAWEQRMEDEFELNDLRRILQECREYEQCHHLGRPFMSAYQIAIRFAERHPQHPLVKLGVGGLGHGPGPSLSSRIARFLSWNIKHRKVRDIEGGFLSHDLVGELWFDDGGEKVRPSGNAAHSVFRWVPPKLTRQD